MTVRLPGLIAHALSAPICSMFHSTGSLGAAIAAPICFSRYRRAVESLPAAAAVWPVAGTSVSRVCPTFCTPVTARILVAKSVAAECAMTTPIGAYEFCTFPPFAVTAWTAPLMSPGAVMTR